MPDRSNTLKKCKCSGTLLVFSSMMLLKSQGSKTSETAETNTEVYHQRANLQTVCHRLILKDVGILQGVVLSIVASNEPNGSKPKSKSWLPSNTLVISEGLYRTRDNVQTRQRDIRGELVHHWNLYIPHQPKRPYTKQSYLTMWLPRVTVLSTDGENKSPEKSDRPSRVPSDLTYQLRRISSRRAANWVTSIVSPFGEIF